MEDDSDSEQNYKNKIQTFFKITFSKFNEKVQTFVFTYDPNNLP